MPPFANPSTVSFYQDAIDTAPNGVTPLTAQTVITGTPGARINVSGTPNGTYDRWAFSSDRGNGMIAGIGINSQAFPSYGQNDDDVIAGRYIRDVIKSRRAYAERVGLQDPSASAYAFADVAAIEPGYNSLRAAGWNSKDAAFATGIVGDIFGGYANLESDAEYLRTFARTRGTDLTTAGRELRGHRAVFTHAFRTASGSGNAAPDAGVNEDIWNMFSGVIGALRQVEDKYDWQFNQNTYRDVMVRTANLAASLPPGMSLGDLNMSDAVQAALSENGALKLRDPMSNPVFKMLRTQAARRDMFTMFDGDARDTLTDPFKAQQAVSANGVPVQTDSADFGLLRAIRKAWASQDARNLRTGLDVTDLTDTSQLRSDLVQSFREYSTGSAGVSDETFGVLADLMINRVKSGEACDITDLARTAALGGRKAGVLDDKQVRALGRWSRSLAARDPMGDRRMNEIVSPFTTSIATLAGVQANHPIVQQFTARLVRSLQRRFEDGQGVAGLRELERMSLPSVGVERDQAAADQGFLKLNTSGAGWEEIQADAADFMAAIQALVRQNQEKIAMESRVKALAKQEVDPD